MLGAILRSSARLRGHAVAHAAVVLAGRTERFARKRDVEYPVECVFHRPVRADGLAQDGRTSGQLDRKQRISASTLGAPLTLRMLSTVSTVRSPGQPLRVSSAAASVLANTRRRTRQPCVSSKAPQSARLNAPTRKQCWSKCSTTPSRSNPAASAPTQAVNPAPNASGSISTNTHWPVSCEGTPRQFQERPGPGQLAAAIQRSVVPALGTGGHCAHRDGQHVNQAALDLAGAARVFDRAETLPQALDQQAPLPRRREGTSSYVRPRQAREILCIALALCRSFGAEPHIHKRRQPSG